MASRSARSLPRRFLGFATDYTPAALDTWASRIAEQPWDEPYVFVKHETAEAPARARRQLDAFAVSSLTYGGAKVQTAEAAGGRSSTL
jgi:uncharacterized protein YecE (DUF72 family)